jgi:crotonobetainyl-CoA:carnitine CoA-transferase CaiB-like acyl-CoA transferase
VRDLREVLTDPHLQARQMIEAVEHASVGSIRVLGVPIKLSDTPGRVRTAPPTLGQHTDQILRSELGFEDRGLDELRRARVI